MSGVHEHGAGRLLRLRDEMLPASLRDTQRPEVAPPDDPPHALDLLRRLLVQFHATPSLGLVTAAFTDAADDALDQIGSGSLRAVRAERHHQRTTKNRGYQRPLSLLEAQEI